MQITADYNISTYMIRSYGEGEVVVTKPLLTLESDEITAENADDTRQMTVTYQKPFIITATQLVEDWTANNPESIGQVDLEVIARLKPELVLLGTGKQIHFPDSRDMLFLQQQGIGIEVMPTDAACRTYNFLVSDGRNVAAALLMIEQ